MKKVLAVLLFLASGASAQEYHLPFKGRWFVMQAGDTINVNQHMELRAQWYGMDFAKTGGASGRELSRAPGAAKEDFYSWDADVLSPVAGRIIEAVDGLPDNPLGVKDPAHAAGNHVVIEAGENRWVFIAHLRPGTVKVSPGQNVEAGQPLGKCGNSGNSDFPHIHMHVQDTPTFNDGNGQNVTFTGLNADLSGKIFRQVDWPLIRGLFVWSGKPYKLSGR